MSVVDSIAEEFPVTGFPLRITEKKNIKHRAVLSSILELILWVDDLFHSEKQNWEQMDKRQQKKQPN